MATDTISYSFLFIHYTLTTYCGSTEMQKVCCDKVNVKKCVSVTKPVVRTRATWRLWWPILWRRQQQPPSRTPTRTATPYLTHLENSWKLKNCYMIQVPFWEQWNGSQWTYRTFWWHGITKFGISCNLMSNDATKFIGKNVCQWLILLSENGQRDSCGDQHCDGTRNCHLYNSKTDSDTISI